MFCPECRRYWKDSELNSGNESKKGSKSTQKVCTVCGTLLARDRMVAEFPASEQTQQAGRVRDKSLTVQEILRETAGPAGAKAQEAYTGQMPLDDRRFPKRRFPFAMDKQGDLQSNEPVKEKRRFAALDMALGFSMLGAIVFVLISLTVRAIMVMPHHPTLTKSVSTAAILTPATPKVAVVPTVKPIESLLPASIAPSWKIVESSVLTPKDGSDAKQVAVATYKSGEHYVRMWIRRLKDVNSASVYFGKLTTQQLADMNSGILQQFTGKFVGDKSHPQFKMDVKSAGQSTSVATAIPGLSLQPHLLEFRNDVNVYAIASDLQTDRDGFAKTYGNIIQ